MGDVAMTSPVVKALRDKYPDVRVVVLTRPFFKPFFRDIENVEFADLDLKERHKGFKGLLRLVKDIKEKYKIDQVADLHDVLRTKVIRTIFRLSGAKTAVINKGRKEKHRLTRYNNKEFKPLKTTFSRYADVFARLGYEVEIPAEVKQRADIPVPDKITGKLGEKNISWVGIAPFAQHKGKIYPLDKMEKLVKTLSTEEGIQIFLFGGGEEERAVTEEWETKYPRTFSVIGKLSLDEELDLMANLDVMLSMDSSAMHMSSLVGLPVVSVWGATHPYAGFFGLGQCEDNAIQRDLDCRPCSIYGNKPCFKGTYECLTDIHSDEIINKILYLLISNIR